MSSSHYAVVEFQHAEKDPEPSSNTLPPTTTTTAWADDIVDLSLPAPVLADDLFHPVIAKVNRLFLGMRAIGTGVAADAVGLGYRLWPTYTGVSFALVTTPVFYCLGLSWTAAGSGALRSCADDRQQRRRGT